MKRTISVLLAILMLSSMFPVSALAAEETSEHISYIYYEDGNWLEIIITESLSRASGTKTGTKTFNYKDSSGNLCWTAVLSGTFTYTDIQVLLPPAQHFPAM